MLTRELKLKLTKKQEKTLNDWLWHLSAIYNFGIRKIELNAKDKIYFSNFDFVNLLPNHSKKMDIPSHTIQGILDQSWTAWKRCFKKLGKKPKLKSIHNKLRSIPFPDPIKQPKNNIIGMPGLGKLRYFKQEIPHGKIKKGRIVKKASGWYLQLTIDSKHIFPIKKIKNQIGMDTGFNHLAALSNGIKIDNHRYFVRGQECLAQAQRGKNKKLIARLHERISNRRKDRNHKVSREIVENYSEIYITKDNLRGQAKKFGKSIGDAGISQLRNFINYKSENHGRKCVLVGSKNSTMTCSACLLQGVRSLTGPKGLGELEVRVWECYACGAVHDRDVNSAMVTLVLGSGMDLVPDVMLGLNRNLRPNTEVLLDFPKESPALRRERFK